MLSLTKKKLYIFSIILAKISLSGNCIYTSKSIASSLSIYPDKVTYKDGNLGEKEMKAWSEETRQMDKSIQLSQETIQALLGGTKVRTLKLVDILKAGSQIFKKINDKEVYDFKNHLYLYATLFTGENTGFKVEEGTVVKINNTPQENSILAMMGINSMYIIFINCGKTIINTEYILFFANRISRKEDNAFLFANYYDSILTLNYRFMALENIIVESLEEGTDLFGNFGTITLGSQMTEISVFSEIIIRGKKASQLFFNKDMCTSTIDGKAIVIKDIDIEVLEEAAYLINNNEIINFGSQMTEKLNFDNIKVASNNEDAYFIYNGSNSALILDSKSIVIKNVNIKSPKKMTYLVYNRDTVYNREPKTAIVFGSETTENLIFEKININGYDYNYFFWNESTIILNGKYIAMKDIDIKSSKKASSLIRNLRIMTFGSKITEKIVFNKINIDSVSNILCGFEDSCLISNFFVLNFNTNSIIITDNTITPWFTFNGNNKDKYSVIFENIGEMNINVNSRFVLDNNKISKDSDGVSVIDFLMATFPNYINPRLNFINNFGKETVIELETIVSSYFGGGVYYKDHNLINSILVFKGIGNNGNDDFTEIEEIIKPTKTSADIKEELFDPFPGMLFANAPITIGSGTSNIIPKISAKANNNNDNCTFSYTNNDNNNNYDEDEEENNRSKGSSLFKLPKIRVVEINKFVIGYTNMAINLIRGAIGLKGVGDGSTLYITKGNKLIIELDEEYDDGNSHTVISGFNIPEEVKERIFLGPISKSKGFVGSFEGNDYIVYKNSGILKKAVEKVKECSIQ